MSTFERLRDAGKITIVGDKLVLWVEGGQFDGMGIILTEDQEMALRESEEAE